jgi:ribonuclease D
MTCSKPETNLKTDSRVDSSSNTKSASRPGETDDSIPRPLTDVEADVELVETSARLKTLAQSWLALEFIGIDTEFVRTDTYFSRPGLVQINAVGAIVLVDPIAIDDLAPLGEIVACESIVKIIHSAAEDMSLLKQITGRVPAPVFDTQIAASYCGLGASPSYGALVAELVGEQVDKSQTRSDWCKRPLTDEQRRYAAEDVRYLPTLYQMLSDRLSQANKTAWASEDFEALARDNSPPSYARIRGAGRLSRQQLALLASIDTWREGEAVIADRPRGHVITDLALINITTAAPTTRELLAALEGVSPKFVRRHSDAVIELVRDHGKLPNDHPLPLPVKVRSEHRATVDALREFVAAQATELKLPPEVIASRRHIETAVIAAAHAQSIDTLRIGQGWRRTLLNPTLNKLGLIGQPTAQ